MVIEESHAEAFRGAELQRKLASYARIAGRGVVERALTLYHCLRDPDTPAWAKSVIAGALGYFVLPLDAVADFTPFVGYGDDLGALAAALAVVTFYVKSDHRERARRALARWFG